MTASSLPPRVIGRRYLIERELGGGGMSTVYVAEDTKHGRRVAIKVLRTDLAPALSATDRFSREIEVTARLTHPNILPLLDSGEEDGLTFYVMPYIQGESLRDLLSRERRLSVSDTIRIAREVADALSYAHEQGIVHRDIKPENILLSAGHAVVADFGIARATSSAVEGMSTKAGLIIGTPAYMSPEQALGEEIDSRADLYALGCVVYEMIAGDPPFFALNLAALLARKLSGQPPEMDALADQASAALRALIERALIPDIDARFQTARELTDAIDALVTGAGGTTTGASPRAPVATRDAIAVLPFVSMSSTGSDDEYIGDGISEELTNALARLKGLRVIARTSAFAFKNSKADVREIGRALNVRWIVEGSVRRSGERMRITAKLIDAESAFEIWSERFDRRAEDLFDIEDEIGTSVAKSLVARLAPRTGSIAVTPTAPKAAAPTSFPAYEQYLKGRHYFAMRTEEGFRKSCEHFERAIHIDPDFALAYAALSDTLTTMGLYGVAAPGEVMPLAIEAAGHALERGGDLAEVLAARACVSAVYEWDWNAAEQGFKRALAANPQYANGHQWYATQCLVPLGRFAEAREALRRARELDPLSLAIGVSVAVVDYYERDYQRAAHSSREVLALDDRFVMGHYFLGLALEQSGDLEGAIRSLEQAATLSPTVEVRAALAHACAAAQHTERARTLLGELISQAQSRYVSPVLIAQVTIALGEHERALGLLRAAHAQRSADLMWLAVRPTFDPLRAHPEFQALLRELRLG